MQTCQIENSQAFTVTLLALLSFEMTDFQYFSLSLTKYAQ